jgi:hypothetical protein
MSLGFLLWWAVGIVSIGMIIREENDVKIWHAPIAVILGLFGPAALVAYICLYRVDFTRVLFKKRVADGTENTSK